MNYIRSFACLMFLLQTLYGGFDYPAFSARHAALSNAYLASTSGKDGFMMNPALSAYNQSLYAALNYTELFGLKEFRFASGVTSLSFKSYGLGIGLESFGSVLYSENKATLNAAKLFYNNTLSIGFSFQFYHLSAQNYEAVSAYGISLGFQYKVLENLHLGAAIANLNQPTLNGYREELPQSIQFGLQYQPTADFAGHFKIEKDSWYDPEISIGAAYRLYNNLQLLTGYATTLNKPSFGVLLNVAKVDVSYGLQHHFDLGMTHFVGIAFHSLH